MKEIANLDPEKDIQIIPNVAPGDMPTALFVSREVDAAITWEPYASEAELKFKNAKVLYDSAAEWHKSFPDSQQFYPGECCDRQPVIYRFAPRCFCASFLLCLRAGHSVRQCQSG